MSTFENKVNAYFDAFKERKLLEKKLHDLENDQLTDTRKLTTEIEFSIRAEKKLYDIVEQCRCGKTAKGHEFPPDDELSELSGSSKTCTKCGFEKK